MVYAAGFALVIGVIGAMAVYLFWPPEDSELRRRAFPERFTGGK